MGERRQYDTAKVLAPRTALQDCVAALRTDGYCVISDAAAADSVTGLADDLSERFERTPFCTGGFFGERTKRFGALLRRSARAPEFVAHPLFLAIADEILGPYCDTVQLNLTQAIAIHPGEAAQPPHRDEGMWWGPKGGMEYLINVMWPLTSFSEENGATLVWPGSHLHPGVPASELGDPVVARMDPGAALVFLGSTLHSGGANATGRVREGLIISYCLGWLKPYENQWLVYPPDVAATFPSALARLVGYQIHRPNLGNVEGRSPDILFTHDPDEALGFVDHMPLEMAQQIARFHQMSSKPEAGL